MKKINNWPDFKEHCSSLPNTKAKGDAFEKLTKHYLEYDPKYVTKLKHVWLLSEVPESIRKKLNLPKPLGNIYPLKNDCIPQSIKYHRKESQYYYSTFHALFLFPVLTVLYP